MPIYIWSSILCNFLYTYPHLLRHHHATHSLRLTSWRFPRGFLAKISPAFLTFPITKMSYPVSPLKVMNSFKGFVACWLPPYTLQCATQHQYWLLTCCCITLCGSGGGGGWGGALCTTGGFTLYVTFWFLLFVKEIKKEKEKWDMWDMEGYTLRIR
jgi:hypothetical protein